MTTRKTPLQKQAEEPGMAGFAAARKLRQQKKDRDAKARDLELRQAMLEIDTALSALSRSYTHLILAGGVDHLASVASALRQNLRVLNHTVEVAR